MLDLKSLEEKLDAALLKESEESLTQWMMNKRTKPNSFLGTGIYEALASSAVATQVSVSCSKVDFVFKSGVSTSGDTDYALAA